MSEGLSTSSRLAKTAAGSIGLVASIGLTSQDGIESMTPPDTIEAGAAGMVANHDQHTGSMFASSDGIGLATGLDFLPTHEPFVGHRNVSKRRALRIIVKQRFAEDYKALIKARNELVQKKFSEAGLSRREELQLADARWRINTIEDARHGEELEFLESFVESQEQLARDVRLAGQRADEAIANEKERNAKRSQFLRGKKRRRKR